MHSAFHAHPARAATAPPLPPTLFPVAAAAAATTPPTADDSRVPIPSSRSRSRARNRAPAPAPSARDDASDSDAVDALPAADALPAPVRSRPAASAAAAFIPPSAAVQVESAAAAERPCTPTEEQIDALEAEEIHTLGEIERARKRVAIKSRQHADIRARLASARKLFAQRQREQRAERVRQLVEEKRMMGRQHSEE